MKVLITGAHGQLGRELVRLGASVDVEVHDCNRHQLDITNKKSIEQVLAPISPGVVINAAAYTHVDRAETDSDLAYAVNAEGPRHLARYCAGHQLALIHISTDYVFDGSLNRPYKENDAVAPLGVYGRSKAQGETAVRSACPRHIIVRTSWLYGVYGQNFVKTILKLAAHKKTLQVVADQSGSPTSAADLASALLIIAQKIATGEKNAWGTYHYCGAGITTWHGLAEKTIELAAAHTDIQTRRVEAISSAQWPTSAPRPPYSALDCTRLKRQFGIEAQPWLSSLKQTIARIFCGS
ncbi:MAG: dTDP-4-dehydrorhamnose reductase [Desulfobacterales bacterium]|nr:dTDP-4-dehydrorhamnose reductase [Desulfobacterales bacterium]